MLIFINLFFGVSLFAFFFVTSSHPIAQAGLEFIMFPRVFLNLEQSSCFSLLSEIIDINHDQPHANFFLFFSHLISRLEFTLFKYDVF